MALILLGASLLALIAATEEARPVVLAAFALAAVAGTTLPDIDQVLPLGGHRSALTHSLLPALPCLGRRLRAAAAGLALGIALHLAADLFPRAMAGYATVKLPGTGALNSRDSYLWLAGNVLAGLALAAVAVSQLMRSAVERWVVLAGAGMFAVSYLSGVEGGWWALALFGGGGAMAWRAARR